MAIFKTSFPGCQRKESTSTEQFSVWGTKKKSFFIQYQTGLSLVQEKMQWTSLKQDSKMEGVGACLLAPQACVLLKAD